MKKVYMKHILTGLATCFAVFIFAGCQNSDVDVKADMATKAKQDKNFEGVSFTVENGSVMLIGECPTEKAKSTVEATAKGIYGVKTVMNNIRIAPVIMGTDEQLKQSVDSVLEKYAGAAALVKDSIVILQGKVKKNDEKKLTTAISNLQPKRVENNLSVKPNS